MHKLLKLFILNNLEVDDVKLQDIAEHFKFRRLARNQILINRGDICNELYFVDKGLLRSYYISEAGHEKTRRLAPVGTLISSLSSFISQDPSFEFIDTLEYSELLVIRRSDFYDLINKYSEMRIFYQILLETAYIFQNKRLENLVTTSALERYQALLRENPRYVHLLSNKVLASYLDITPETLSRIKSK